MGGFQALKSAQLQAWAMALSIADKERLTEAIIAALAPRHSANGMWFDPTTNFIETPRNERVETKMIYANLILFTVHYRPV
jgi:hypothetical protein